MSARPLYALLLRVVWLAIALLIVVTPVPRSAGAAEETEGQLLGTLPPPGGIALMQWTGGSMEALYAAAPEVTSFWVTADGALIGYIVSAPEFVNDRFLSLMPGGTLPAQALLVSSVQPRSASPSIDCARDHCVALTLDDGPGQYTQEVLDILSAHGARATFFVEGMEAKRRPQALAAIAEAGHEIGNHTYTHPDLTTLTVAEMQEEIDRTADIVREVTGVTPAMLRPPGGAYDERVRDSLGLPVILWSVDPKDYRADDPEVIAARVSASVRRGSIILLHETKSATVEALPAILEMLEERGLVPVTVGDLFGGRLEPGQVYTNR